MTLFNLGYIGEFEIVDDHRSGKIVVQLNGRLNKTGVISPRYNVQVNQIENWVNLLLPARGFGIIILVGRRSKKFSARFANLTIPDDLLGHLGPRRGSTEERWRQAAGICVLAPIFCTDVAPECLAIASQDRRMFSLGHEPSIRPFIKINLDTATTFSVTTTLAASRRTTQDTPT